MSKEKPAENPVNEKGSGHVASGGGWYDAPGSLRSLYRGYSNPSIRFLISRGLRIARTKR